MKKVIRKTNQIKILFLGLIAMGHQRTVQNLLKRPFVAWRKHSKSRFGLFDWLQHEIYLLKPILF